MTSYVRRLVVLAALALTLTTIASPAQARASRLDRAEAIVKASDRASIWHEPGRGYLAQDRNQMQSVDEPALVKALRHCHADSACVETTRGYFRQLHHDWRVLNRSLWIIADTFPRCSDEIVDNCKNPAGGGAAGVVIHGRWYVAQQRGVFAT